MSFCLPKHSSSTLCQHLWLASITLFRLVFLSSGKFSWMALHLQNTQGACLCWKWAYLLPDSDAFIWGIIEHRLWNPVTSLWIQAPWLAWGLSWGMLIDLLELYSYSSIPGIIISFYIISLTHIISEGIWWNCKALSKCLEERLEHNKCSFASFWVILHCNCWLLIYFRIELWAT